jgi:flagellar hook-length control protein FliK
MGVTIQRMAGGQLEVQAAEPAKVAAEAQLMRQVTDRLESHDMKQGTDRISLRLSPEHLGNLQLNLRMEDQQVRVEIVAEHRAVREALLQQVDQLKEILARQNIKMESFDVTTASNGGLTQQQQGDWRQAASERRTLYAQQYGASRSAGSFAGGAESSMQYFAQQYQSTLDVRF